VPPTVLPKNIYPFSEDEESSNNSKSVMDESFNLVDQCDRLSSVTVHEVIMSPREDVAKFLCFKHNASVDVANHAGTFPKMMAFLGGGGGGGGFQGCPAEIVRQNAIRSRESVVRTCNGYNKSELDAQKFKYCSQCDDVRYCNRECQVADWSNHKQFCQAKEIQLARQEVDPTDDGDDGDDASVISAVNRNGLFEGGSFSRPDHVWVNEKFWIKVHAIDLQTPLLIYDESRSFSIRIFPGEPGFRALHEKVKAELTSMGRKCHIKAEFDANGNCTVYPHTASLKQW